MMSATPKRLPTPPSAFDVLRVPLLGRALKSRNGRLIAQIPFLLAALVIVYDGFTGTDNAARNLAGVVPWVHFRGAAVIVLLLLGNLFCMGCPFTLPRTLARRFVRPRRRFPKILRNKWLAVAGLVALFFSYEWLNLWASPLLTAWLIVAYFAASFALEFLFDESAFCKYVCPLGSFNFVYATVSPAKIEARNPEICKTCVGKECVNGAFIPLTALGSPQAATSPVATQGAPKVLGCPTELFVPQIKSNLDCTHCLECARACPHDNVALTLRKPGRVLFTPDAWPKRWDVIALIVSLTGFAIVNAFGMIPPVYEFIRGVALTLGATGDIVPPWAEAVALAVLFVGGGVILPLGAVIAVSGLSRALTRTAARLSLRDTTAAFTPALVPLGLGIWAAHYGFHFLVGAFALIPVLQTFLTDHGIGWLGAPDWTLAGEPNLELVALLQIAMLVGGFITAVLVAERTATRLYRRDSFIGLMPWAMLLLALTALAFLIFTQPMEMRGTIYISS